MPSHQFEKQSDCGVVFDIKKQMLPYLNKALDCNKEQDLAKEPAQTNNLCETKQVIRFNFIQFMQKSLDPSQNLN